MFRFFGLVKFIRLISKACTALKKPTIIGLIGCAVGFSQRCEVIDKRMATMDFSFIKLFSAPATAFFILAIIIASFGYAVFKIGSDKKGNAATTYWKRLSLVAEVLIAVGLVGLATFAGMAKISADHQNIGELVRLSQATVGEDFRLAILANCETAGLRVSLPYNPAVAKKELCAISRSYVAVYAPDANWELAEKSLRAFSDKYPGCIENVFTRNSDCEDTVGSAMKIAGHIQAMETAKQSLHADETSRQPYSWGFLLLAFILAALGGSIKCARAAAEF